MQQSREIPYHTIKIKFTIFSGSLIMQSMLWRLTRMVPNSTSMILGTIGNKSVLYTEMALLSISLSVQMFASNFLNLLIFIYQATKSRYEQCHNQSANGNMASVKY